MSINFSSKSPFHPFHPSTELSVSKIPLHQNSIESDIVTTYARKVFKALEITRAEYPNFPDLFVHPYLEDLYKRNLSDIWSHIATAQKNSEDQLKLGLFCEKEGNLVAAKSCYHIAANRGNPQAQYNLGIIYNTEGNVKKAKKWYQKAADQDLFRAQNSLACILHNNENKLAAAKFWIQRAANHGDPDAQNNLAHSSEIDGLHSFSCKNNATLPNAKKGFQKTTDRRLPHAKHHLRNSSL